MATRRTAIILDRSVNGRFLAGVVAGLAALGFAAWALGGGRAGWLQTWMVIFSSLIISALPFVALGAVAASIVAVFVPMSAIERIGRLPRPLQLPVAAVAGVGFPICECGSVPLARRLMLRGVPPGAAITFMLAAPVVNPVVMASTFVAYRGRGSTLLMVGGRVLLGASIAMAVGWVLGRKMPEELLRESGEPDQAPVDFGRPESRWGRFFGHVVGDFTFMAKYLVGGAVVAAVVQTFLPQRIVQGLSAVPVIEIVAMMGLAAILSLCSESDAFIASSFSQYGFGPSSQLAFLVFGPMVDMKLGAMYGGTFKPSTVGALVATAAVATLGFSLWLELAIG
ncbi:MAG: permease [Actinomycetota bacterium]|nr:permease [Actinomycetota bacterium]